MNRFVSRLGAPALVALALVGGYLAFRHLPDADAPEADSEATVDPVVPVRTVTLKRTTITMETTAYGRVVARAGAAQVVTVPFETTVPEVFVVPGQNVAADDPLVKIRPSPSAQLELAQASNDLSSAKKMLEVTKGKLADGLATRSDLAQAEQAEQAAKLRLGSLAGAGVGQGVHTLRAEHAGVVKSVDVTPGALVSAGSPMVQLVVDELTEVDLGVPRSDVGFISADLPIHQTAVSGVGQAAVEGKVRMVSNRRNPSSGLVDVFVSVPAGAHFLLDDYVSGRIPLRSKQALVVPRDAVVLSEEGAAVFTVVQARAKQHRVTVGLETDELAEVSGGGIAEGAEVVVVGSYELTDGMAVVAEARK